MADPRAWRSQEMAVLAGATVSRRESGRAVGIVRQLGDQAPLNTVAKAVVQAGHEAGHAVGRDD